MRPAESLTERQKSILRMICQGMKDREIAAAIGTTAQVVKNWNKQIRDMIGADCKRGMAAWAMQNLEVQNGTPSSQS